MTAPASIFSPEISDVIEASPLEWARYCVLIENKQKEMVAFDPNIYQQRMSEVYETCQEMGIPTRMACLKPRQSGSSTFSTMIVTHHCKRYQARAVVMADDFGNSQNLYRMITRHCDSDAYTWGITHRTANKEVHFSNGSFAELDTANNPKAGISATRQVVHLSEVAKYPQDGVRDAYVTISNMMASLNKKGPNSLAIMETTAEGACYDESTEVLTDSGWKKFEDLLESDRIFTKNPTSGIAYYQESWIPQKHWHSGRMIEISARGINLRVTPNHNVYVARQKGATKLQPAESMLGTSTDFYFDRGSKWTASGMDEFIIPSYTHRQGNGWRTIPEKRIPIDVWIRFFGHWITEGHVSFVKSCKCVAVTQKTLIAEFRKSCSDMAKAMGCKLREIEHGSDGAIRWIFVNAQLANYLKDFTKPKHIPRNMLMELSEQQCRNLIDAIWEGDGLLSDRKTGCDHSKIYVGNDEPFADTFQELAIKAGYASTVIKSKNGQFKATFTQNTRSNLKCGNPPIETETPGEWVYCVTLPKDHLLMVRRNGINAWCGNSGFFYDQWQEAVSLDEFLAGKTGNGWIKVFAAWFEFEDHQMDVNPGQAADILATLDRDEKRGRERYGWTVQQIAWRRMVLKTECGGDLTQFNAHYPEDPESCFAASGRPRFDMDGMLLLQSIAKSHMRPQFGTFSHNQSVAWTSREENEASILMFEEPREGCRYIVAVDCATGASYTRGADPDCHAAIVMRAGYRDEHGQKYPPRIVCTLRQPCRLDIDILANLVERMSLFYGKCLIVPERNMGIALIEMLRTRNLPIFQDEVIDMVTSKTSHLLGWETNRESKRRCVERLASLIRDTTASEPKILLDEHTLSECRTFVVDAKGGCAAQSGKHDDAVMCAAIAVTCIESATTLQPLVRRRREPADRKSWSTTR